MDNCVSVFVSQSSWSCCCSGNCFITLTHTGHMVRGNDPGAALSWTFLWQHSSSLECQPPSTTVEAGMQLKSQISILSSLFSLLQSKVEREQHFKPELIKTQNLHFYCLFSRFQLHVSSFTYCIIYFFEGNG